MLVAAMILQISCQQDDSFSPAADSAIINLSVSAANSGTTMDNDDTASAIKSLCILQFNADGNAFGTLRHVGMGKETAPNSGKYSATLLQSVDTIAVCPICETNKRAGVSCCTALLRP